MWCVSAPRIEGAVTERQKHEQLFVDCLNAITAASHACVQRACDLLIEIDMHGLTWLCDTKFIPNPNLNLNRNASPNHVPILEKTHMHADDC